MTLFEKVVTLYVIADSLTTAYFLIRFRRQLWK